ncbi:hypothetical protein QWJ41_14875 [Nocardioides sp. SOB44]|uniref:DUF1707 domain-containing protein n=1 Tax=Nocardioides cremeus TaxID=3058044 RepID=A0ABT8TVJ2_9ACTN|nr:hypothetical protein [Nocardioides cremeus]MDO3397008.1 hypothetical protein [Nocardioides cremeus]
MTEEPGAVAGKDEPAAQQVIFDDDQEGIAIPPLAARRLAAIRGEAKPAAEILRQITDQTASYRAISEQIDQAANPRLDLRLGLGMPGLTQRNLVSGDQRTPQIDDLVKHRQPLSAMEGYADWQRELVEQREELAREQEEAEAALAEYGLQRATLEAERHEQMLSAMRRSADHTSQLLEEHRHSRGLQVGTFVVAFLGLLGGILVPAWPGLPAAWRVVMPVAGTMVCVVVVWLLVRRRRR